MSPRGATVLRVLGRLLDSRSWATAAEVSASGAGRTICAAGRLLADLSREGLVELWRHSTGRAGPTKYRLTIDGHRCLELEERNEGEET
jgi:hypothetical protein